MKRKEVIQLQDKIINSEGIKCIDRMNYHNSCILILNGNFDELSNALLYFENLKNALELMDQNNTKAAEEYQYRISRLLHNFLASAKSLIEHTRIFIKRYYSGTAIQKKYTQKIGEEFKNDELSKFIQDLRNYILHNGLPYTGLILKPDLKTTVFLDRDLMLHWKNWTALSRSYLLSQPGKIKVYNFVNEYVQKVDAFNQWLNIEIKKYHKKDLEELDTLRENYREISKNIS